MLDPDVMIAKAKKARELGADIVLGAMHAGDEYSSVPNAEQTSVAHALADSGQFTMIYGHHTHSVLPIEKYKGTWIVYGLGNGDHRTLAELCGEQRGPAGPGPVQPGRDRQVDRLRPGLGAVGDGPRALPLVLRWPPTPRRVPAPVPRPTRPPASAPRQWSSRWAPRLRAPTNCSSPRNGRAWRNDGGRHPGSRPSTCCAVFPARERPHGEATGNRAAGRAVQPGRVDAAPVSGPPLRVRGLRGAR